MAKILNPLHLEQLIKTVNRAPYFAHIGLTVTRLGHGFADVEIALDRRHINAFGTVHGGVYASLLDTACYWAAYCDQPEEAGFTSMDLSVTNLAMATSGRITCHATAIKEGRSVCLCEGRILDENGKLLAHGTSKLLILNGRQSIADVLKTAGEETLPQKFLG